MQRDEEHAIEIKNKHRNIFETVTNEFNGRIIQYFGDGTLSIFESAIDAVTCGIELQRQWINQKIKVRVGIHVGDIIVNKDDIVGDGVNVASRVQSLGVSGSVLISDKVFDEVKNKPDIQTKKLGKFSLKNVSHNPVLFAIEHPDLIVPKSKEIKSGVKPSTKASSIVIMFILVSAIIASALFYFSGSWSGKIEDLDQIKIAVIPFSSNDGSKVDFCQGVSEEIISRIAVLPDLKVLSSRAVSNLAWEDKTLREIRKMLDIDYLIDGNVQFLGEQLKINIELVNLKDETNIWADNFGGSVSEIFVLQTDIAQQVAQKLNVRYLASRGDNPQNYDSVSVQLYLEGLSRYNDKQYAAAYQDLKLSYESDSLNEHALFKLIELSIMNQKLQLSSTLPALDFEGAMSDYENLTATKHKAAYLRLWSSLHDNSATKTDFSKYDQLFGNYLNYQILKYQYLKLSGDRSTSNKLLKLIKRIDPTYIEH